MTDPEKEEALAGFREGKYNILVATSVLEEGIDVPACNLVIRYDHVTNEIAKVLKNVPNQRTVRASPSYPLLQTIQDAFKKRL